jgi:TRAP-type C4-dicarboxylate transport system permease small subunit
MGLKKGIDLLNRLNRPLMAIVKHIALWILAGMMFLTFVDVLFRYVFNSPILGAPELIEFMMAIFVTFSVVYCAYKKSHINVDLVIVNFPVRVRKWLECITSFITLILFILIAWQAFMYLADEYGSGLTSPVLYIPVYPFIAAVAAGFVVICLVLLSEFLSNLSEVAAEWTRS